MSNIQNETIDDGGESASEYRFFAGVVAIMVAAAILGSIALTVQKSIGGHLGFGASLLVLLVGGAGLNFWIKTKKQELENSA